jgi:hypothetical protein
VCFRLRSVRNGLRKRSPPQPTPWDSPPGGEGQAAGLGKEQVLPAADRVRDRRRLAAPALVHSQPGTQAAILRHLGQLKQLSFPFSRAFFEAPSSDPAEYIPAGPPR